MRISRIAIFAAALTLGACGGSGAGDATTENGLVQGDVGSGGGAESGQAPVNQGPVNFDASGLSQAALSPSSLRAPELPDRGPEPFSVDPVIDTCAALGTAELSGIDTEVATRYSFGEEREFTASSFGAACRYESGSHVLTVIVGSTDQVSPDEDSPAMRLPIGAEEIIQSASPDDGSVTILSEDSFGFEVMFGAYATSGSSGILVLNTGGTGIDSSAEGVLFAQVASAVAAGVGGAPPPSADEPGQQAAGEGVDGLIDPCSVWSVAEIDAFLPDYPIVETFPGPAGASCSWLAADSSLSVTLMLEPEGSPSIQLQPDVEALADGSPIFFLYSRAYVETDEYALSVDIFDATGTGISDDTAAETALAQDILARTSAG